MVIRHTPKERTPIESMDKKLEEARLRDLPSKAETGFIRKKRKKYPSRYDDIEEERDDQK